MTRKGRITSRSILSKKTKTKGTTERITSILNAKEEVEGAVQILPLRKFKRKAPLLKLLPTTPFVKNTPESTPDHYY